MKKSKDKVNKDGKLKYKVLWIIFLILIAPILIFNITIMVKSQLHPDKVPDFMGYKPFVVMSGSMQSGIMVGDLVVVKITDAGSINKDDIIAFRDSEDNVTTHRVIEVVSENNEICFKTKGDNNNVEDENLACASSLEGKYAFKLSGVGNFVLFVQQPLGFTIMMMSLFIVGLMISLFSSKSIDDKYDEEDLKYRKEFEEFKRKQKEKELE